MKNNNKRNNKKMTYIHTTDNTRHNTTKNVILSFIKQLDAYIEVIYISRLRCLYWTSMNLTSSNSLIRRMDIHVSLGKVDLLVSNLSCPSAIAIDETGLLKANTHTSLKTLPIQLFDHGFGLVFLMAARKLFWVDCQRGRLEMADLDGSNRQLLNASYLWSWQTMALDDNYVYLADWLHRLDIY